MLVKSHNSGKVVISEGQQRILRELATSRTCPKILSQRSRIILMAFERYKNDEIGAAVGLERHAVGPWRRRWVQAFHRLIHVECGGKRGVLGQRFLYGYAFTEFIPNVHRNCWREIGEARGSTSILKWMIP